MHPSAVVEFTLLAALLTLIPGVDFALIVRATLRSGRGAGLATGAGVCSGLFVWACLSALGFTALLAASRLGYQIVHVAGAVYLVGLGARTVVRSRRPLPGTLPHGEPTRRSSGRLPVAYARGLATNLLNPKVGLFYVSVLPQFVPDAGSVLADSLLSPASMPSSGSSGTGR